MKSVKDVLTRPDSQIIADLGKLNRRQAVRLLAGAAVFPQLATLADAVSALQASVTPSDTVDAKLTLEQIRFLHEVERAACLYFWEQASETTGQVRDRARADGVDETRRMSSTASTGFGLTGLCIANKHGYLPGKSLARRVRLTLDFLLNEMPHEHGFFYHFVDMETGKPYPNPEVSSIDTSLLLCGVLTARAHFEDPQIKSLATQIYERVEWPWMLDNGKTFSMGWKPNQGFLRYRWDSYSELMMLYLLAVGSPTHPVEALLWDGFRRPMFSYAGFTYISGAAPLFTHHYSHAWFDFRYKRDRFADYFANSIMATLAHKEFCLSLRKKFPDYSEDFWGITASDYEHGYAAWGGPPAQGPIDGTMVPAATGGSLPFVPQDCLHVLMHTRSEYGAKAWKRYGFVDALNPLTGWVDPDVLGIDQGITLLMAENLRTGFVWDTFMSNPEPQDAMTKVGFQPTNEKS